MTLQIMSYFIIWNIGQGQFTTYVDTLTCRHFDVGGEVNIMPQIKKICFNKINFIYLSHWDLDHVRFALEFQKKQFNSCVIPPKASPKKRFAKKIFQNLKLCSSSKSMTSDPQLLYGGNQNSQANSNDQSMVYQFHKILLPGDSTQAQEKIWSTTQHKVDYIVLGHHGSRSSTSPILLKHLKEIHGAICSARKKKYNHPHFEVVQSLKKNKIPLLQTEDWGHIAIERSPLLTPTSE